MTETALRKNDISIIISIIIITNMQNEDIPICFRQQNLITKLQAAGVIYPTIYPKNCTTRLQSETVRLI